MKLLSIYSTDRSLYGMRKTITQQKLNTARIVESINAKYGLKGVQDLIAIAQKKLKEKKDGVHSAKRTGRHRLSNGDVVRGRSTVHHRGDKREVGA